MFIRGKSESSYPSTTLLLLQRGQCCPGQRDAQSEKLEEERWCSSGNKGGVPGVTQPNPLLSKAQIRTSYSKDLQPPVNSPQNVISSTPVHPVRPEPENRVKCKCHHLWTLCPFGSSVKRVINLWGGSVVDKPHWMKIWVKRQKKVWLWLAVCN